MKPQVSLKHYLHSYNTQERFLSYWEQINLISSHNAQSVLEIGKGNGFFSNYISKVLGLKCETVDIDPDLKPDHLLSIFDLPRLGVNQYDAVVAFQVLEHLSFEDLDNCIKNLVLVSKKNVFISLPHYGWPFELALRVPYFKQICFSCRLPKPPKKWRLEIEGFGQHFWEIGVEGCSLKRVRKILSKHAKITKEFPNPLWTWHRFFVLEKL